MMYLEALTPERKLILDQLVNFTGFYLAGGTAVALQIGHRQSVDFDLFSDKKISRNLLKTAEDIFSRHLPPMVNNSGELTLTIDGTKITFLTYPFPIIRDLVDFNDLKLLSLPELAATKAYTIGRRGSLKDYVDLYAIISGQHATLELIIKLAKTKFGDVFNDRLFLEQLIYLEDVEDEPIAFITQPTDRSTLEAYFEKAIQKFQLGK